MNETDERIEKAWKLREDGNPLDSISLLTQILNEKLKEQEWDKVIDIAIDMHISWKNLGKNENNTEHLNTSISYLNLCKDIAQRENVPLRNDWYLYMGAIQIETEKYDEAISSYEEYLNQEKPKPEKLADINAHMGYAKCKKGEKDEGIKMIKDAIETLDNPSEEFVHEGKNVAIIWKTGAKLFLAKVVEDKNEAKSLIQEIIDESKEKGLGARQKQAETLLKTKI
ncbi:tol-pal system YbgF family protein [Patescibacteria group bacterium]